MAYDKKLAESKKDLLVWIISSAVFALVILGAIAIR
jgi:hypothetical protein